MLEFTRPVTILTGFLGAGKTTFLNYFLQHNKDTRYAIIENEFGEQGIDGQLVVRPEETIVELNNGCLCCTLNDNLYDILNDLYVRREEFDEVIIEATGIADPTGLAQPFVIQRKVKRHFPLKGIICLVDAEQIENQLIETEEAKNQVAFSDVLLVNKTDLVEDKTVDELKQKLQQLNPLASILTGNQQHYPAVDLAPKQLAFGEVFTAPNGDLPLKQDHQFVVSKPQAPAHKHTEGIVSHSFHFDQAFDYQMLDQQLFVYLMLQSEGLYRMKGVVWLEGSDDRYIVQSVGKRLDIEKGTPWQSDEKRTSTIVFIGKNLKREGLENLLNKCLSKRNTTIQ